MNSKFAGEVRFVVENNGAEKLDTGFNRNVFLDKGLHFFGGGKGNDLTAFCLVGVGNSVPTVGQTGLDQCVAGVTGKLDSREMNYVDTGDNTYKCSSTKKFVFEGLEGNNISEVGLASQYVSPSNNYTCTRALVKDSLGVPTVLSLIKGDVLTIYYKIWAVYSTLDADQLINMSDGYEATEEYNVKTRLALVARSSTWANIYMPFKLVASDVGAHSGDITDIKGSSAGLIAKASSVTLSEYENNYNRIATIRFLPSNVNSAIRALVIDSTYQNVFGAHQIRFGKVTDDDAISKDNTKELTIPIRFSWGRYEGAL